jgi:hypothetical protein
MQHIRKERPGKHQAQGHSVRNYTVPYMNQTYSGNTGQVQGGNTNAQQTYTPGQTDTQGQLGGLWQSFMQGNIPSSFTNPAAATNAYNTNFQTQVAPGLAAQYGAGSPVIGSQNALGLAQLQGNLYNTGVNNYQGALSGGSNYALGMPTGNVGSYGNQGVQQQSGQNQYGINPLALLGSLIPPTQ